MKPIICTDVDRFKDLPRYTVRVYDIDSPKEFDNYECFFYERGFDLEELLEEAKERIKEYGTTTD